MPKSIADKLRESARRSYAARTRRISVPAENIPDLDVAGEVDGTIGELVTASEGQLKLARSFTYAGIERRHLEVGASDAFEIRFDERSASIKPGPEFDDPMVFLTYLRDDFVRQVAKLIARQAVESGRPLFTEASNEEEAEEGVRMSVTYRTKDDGISLGRAWAARATVRQLKALLEHFEDVSHPGSTSPWEICESIQAGNDESEPTWFDDDGETWAQEADPEILDDDDDWYEIYGEDLYRFWDVDNEAELDALPAEYMDGFVKGALKVAKQIRKDAERV